MNIEEMKKELTDFMVEEFKLGKCDSLDVNTFLESLESASTERIAQCHALMCLQKSTEKLAS